MAAQYVADIGRRIRERRDELGMTQEDVARELPGKISGNQVSRWERGAHRPGDSQLESLAKVLRVQVAYFFSDGPAGSAQAGTGENRSVLDLDASQLERVEAKLDNLSARLGRIEEALGVHALDSTADPAEALERELEAAAQPSDSRNAGNAATGRARRPATR